MSTKWRGAAGYSLASSQALRLRFVERAPLRQQGYIAKNGDKLTLTVVYHPDSPGNANNIMIPLRRRGERGVAAHRDGRHGGSVSASHAAPIALRDAFTHVTGIDGAEAPGADAFLPATPRVFSSQTIARVARTAERLWSAFDVEVRRALESKGAAALARSLGFEPCEVELIAATQSILAPPVRADFVPTRQGYRLVEWNVDPCLGGLAGRMLFDCFEQAGATRGLSYRDPAVALVPTFARLVGQVRGVLVAIREADLPRWRLNAQRFAEIAREAGLDSRVVPLERLTYGPSEAGALPWGVVRFFHIEHVSGARAEVARLVEASRDGRIKLLYGFDTELWGDKQWLARVPAAANLKSDLARAVPETRAACDVERVLLSQQDEWVLKPHAGAAGEGVLVGREQSASDWRAAVERATQRPGWVAQRLASPRPTLTAYVDARSGRVVRRKEIETLGIFLVEGRYAGAYVRSIPFATGIVVDSSSNFNMVATRERAPRAKSYASRGDAVKLPPALRRIWRSPTPAALGRRLRAFEGLAVEHLAIGGGALKEATPERASRGFRSARMPQEGEGVSAIVRALREDLLPFCHDKRDPTYVAHLDIPPADLSIAAGVLVRALAQDPVTWTSSRAGTFVEQEVLRWLASLVFPQAQHAGGIACAGGTQANLHAILLARNLALPDAAHLGIATAIRKSGARSLKVLASSAAHGSVGAAVRHTGIGDENLILLPIDAADAVRLDALEDALVAAAHEGDKIALVVLNAGTVGVGAIDPLPEAIAVAKRYGARVHVDAAHGAMLLFSRRYAPRLAGIELADSVAADPHKILGLNQGLGALLLQDHDDAGAVVKDPVPYFASAPDTPSFARFTLDGTRPLQALGAWILMRHLGRVGYEQIVDHLFALTDRFVEGLERTGGFELYARPAMNLVAFRETGARGADIRGTTQLLDAATRARRHVSRYQSPRGEFLRAVFVNPATTGKEINGLLAILAAR
jgi:glutamate/tyrosine decarboxylase-like PLP-dependent enzyme